MTTINIGAIKDTDDSKLVKDCQLGFRRLRRALSTTKGRILRAVNEVKKGRKLTNQCLDDLEEIMNGTIFLIISSLKKK